jgi:hypothetical protein
LRPKLHSPLARFLQGISFFLADNSKNFYL